MTAREEFNLEKEALNTASKVRDEIKDSSPRFIYDEQVQHILDFGRRCMDEAYEKAAGIAAAHETIETGAISDKILALKSSPKVKP